MYSPKLNFFYFPYHNTGGHFVNWSTYYLSGKNYYLSCENYKPLLLPSEIDYQLKNFHQHQTKRIKGPAEVIDFLHHNHKNPYTDIINLYLTPRYELASEKLLEVPQEILGETIESHVENSVRAIAESLNYLQDQNHPVIMCKYHDDDYLNLFYNDRYPSSIFDGRALGTIDDVLSEWESLFFKETGQFFKKDIWDQREKLALTIRPWAGINRFDLSLNTSRPHLMYNTDDIWNDLPKVILEILDFTDSKLQQQRWDSWLAVHHQWRTRHDQSFSRNFNKIIDSIVNNQYLSLKRYNMNFYKEVLIQHALIFHHDLNLKTWQLSRFPDNTQDLHALLEPNMHDV